jgi:iron-sulfur cluster assembly 1
LAPLAKTDKARNQIKRLQECNNIDGTQKALRLGVRTRGCNGMAYILEWQDRGDNVGKFDEVVDVGDDIQVILDSRAVMHVVGSTMDFQRDKLAEEFVFLNPNATGICGCGESFSTDTPVDQSAQTRLQQHDPLSL